MSLWNSGYSAPYQRTCERLLRAVRITPGLRVGDYSEILGWPYDRAQICLAALERCGEVVECLPDGAYTDLAQRAASPEEWRGLGTFFAVEDEDCPEKEDEPSLARIEHLGEGE